ncbi:MAG TPA: hypothetical protein VFU23_10270 [Gemmatimonadales bacterium]|nr:hypothetical protein [Gemmatimonadales bacterium]
MARSTRTALLASSVLGLLLVSACSKSDPRLEKLTVGISKDSVLTIMGVQKARRLDPYMTGGHFIEALYFTPADTPDTLKVRDRNMSPVIVIDGKLTAWGWKQWDSIAGVTHIQVAKKG